MEHGTSSSSPTHTHTRAQAHKCTKAHNYEKHSSTLFRIYFSNFLCRLLFPLSTSQLRASIVMRIPDCYFLWLKKSFQMKRFMRVRTHVRTYQIQNPLIKIFTLLKRQTYTM